MHAYDASKLNLQQGFKIDFANQTETFAALDANSYTITSENLMVSEAGGRVLALAGVMGGAESAISEQSAEIVLEAACFEAKTVRRSSRLTGISTESSRRFERGTDPELVKIALMRAYELIQEMAGGEAEAYGYLSTVDQKHAPALNLSFNKFKELTGHTISPTRSEEILSKLGFRIIQVTDKFIQVDVPSFRQKDVTRSIDLIEELARFEGLNAIEAMPLPGVKGFLPETNASLTLKKTLVAQGLLENISSSLVSDNYELTQNSAEIIKMRNPLSKEHTQLRSSLIPGLLKAAAHNFRRQQSTVKLFEFGKIYFKEVQTSFGENFDKQTNTQEVGSLGILISGKNKQTNWQGNLHSSTDFYELKGLIEVICLKKGKLVFSSLEAEKHNFLHPAASAKVVLNGQSIGVLGAIHPLYAKKFEVPENTFVAEINLAALPDKAKFKLKALNDQPSMQRDFTADLPKDSEVSFEDIHKVIQACKLNNLEETNLVSLYQNKESGVLSISFRLTFQGQNTNLTNDEINGSMKELRETLGKKLPAISFRD